LSDDILEVRDRNPFGEDIDEKLLRDPGRSATYLEGYSDLRTQRERAVAQGDRPDALPFRLQWVRAERVGGGTDNRKVAEWKARGYKILTYADAQKLGVHVEDSAAEKGSGGDVRLGDCVLMIADAKTAATNYHKWRSENDAQWEKRVKNYLEDSADRTNRDMGLTEKTGTAFEFEAEPVRKR